MKFLVVILFTLFSSILGGDVSSLIDPSLFNEMLKHRDDDNCPGKGFYTYKAFMDAARSFHAFGTTGDDSTRKRELAAFFGQTSHETTGGWASAPDGPFAWGYCYVREGGQTGPGYYGRGPIQLTGQSNYELAGEAIGVDLVNNPDLVATDPTISFKAAIWFWMTPQWSKPSCHDVITGRWSPSAVDQYAGRVPGYGVITNIINGGVECGKGSPDERSINRVGFYKRYCDLFGIWNQSVQVFNVGFGYFFSSNNFRSQRIGSVRSFDFWISDNTPSLGYGTNLTCENQMLFG